MTLKYPSHWLERKGGPKISVITAYDYTFARLIDRSQIDAVLVGDSLGMMIQGKSSTLPVTVDEMVYHSSLVRRGTQKFMISDIPFGVIHTSFEVACSAAVRLMKEAGADAVKIEGASEPCLNVIRHLTANGIPVMGHLGFLPQSIHTLGGYRIQGKSGPDALVAQSVQLERAGAFAMVLELVADSTAAEITKKTSIPTIGIGSGNSTDGQVQVLHDVLGLDPDFRPKHAMRMRDIGSDLISACSEFHNSIQIK